MNHFRRMFDNTIKGSTDDVEGNFILRPDMTELANNFINKGGEELFLNTISCQRT